MANIPAGTKLGAASVPQLSHEHWYKNWGGSHAEIYATNLGGGTPLFAGTWDLGDVAATGLTQNQINLGFTTDADVSPGNQPLPGQFLYQVQGDSAFYAGQITAVPEPTTLLLGVSACVVGCLAAVRRKTIA